MGIVHFKADGYTPIVQAEEEENINENQLKEAQSYVDQLANQRKHVKAEAWKYLYFRKEDDGLYLRCCFDSIGPYCNAMIHDDPRVLHVYERGLGKQEDQIRAWVPNAPRVKMDIFAWSEVYCVNFQIKKYN